VIRLGNVNATALMSRTDFDWNSDWSTRRCSWFWWQVWKWSIPVACMRLIFLILQKEETQFQSRNTWTDNANWIKYAFDFGGLDGWSSGCFHDSNYDDHDSMIVIESRKKSHISTHSRIVYRKTLNSIMRQLLLGVKLVHVSWKSEGESR